MKLVNPLRNIKIGPWLTEKSYAQPTVIMSTSYARDYLVTIELKEIRSPIINFFPWSFFEDSLKAIYEEGLWEINQQTLYYESGPAKDKNSCHCGSAAEYI